VRSLISERPNLTGQPVYLNGSNPVNYRNRAAFSLAVYIQPFGNTNFAPPSTLNSNSTGFGVFTSTFPARQIQLALKLVF
jgi:hypothetical protein